ncbi:MAG: hypothetical protein ACF8PN_17550 [Phycisphaerales bacterium]
MLNRSGCYFIASVDPPTDLMALARLHHAAPGRVYIHLGGRTPEEPRVGRALMHTKTFLAESDSTCRLWVGSHNLTAMALGGGNFEASIDLTAESDAPVIEDARAHLEACRTTAEPFDPGSMSRYVEIQKRKLPKPEEITKKSLLVIHAEALVTPISTPFTAYLLVTPTDYDGFFRIDRSVRLFLHPVGSLTSENGPEVESARLWEGAVTAVVRTEMHPTKRGTAGVFSRADYEIDLPNEVTPPRFQNVGTSTSNPSTQVVVRLVGEMEPGSEIYSTSSRPMYQVEMDADESGEALHPVSRELIHSFTDESVRDGLLIYRRLHGMRGQVRLSGPDTTMPDFAEEFPPYDIGLFDQPEYTVRQPKKPLDAFFYLSKYVMTRDRGES